MEEKDANTFLLHIKQAASGCQLAIRI